MLKVLLLLVIIINCLFIVTFIRDLIKNNESGDLIVPVNKGVYSFDKVTGELGEVILNNIKGRENEDEITFFKTVGSGVLDVVTARRIYEKALKNKAGEIVNL